MEVAGRARPSPEPETGGPQSEPPPGAAVNSEYRRQG